MSTNIKTYPCIILIGMAGAGKSTIGNLLAKRINWAFADSDYVIESLYGRRLQNITDALGKERFLDTECLVIQSLRLSRCVLATGGSVVHREEAMHHLNALGPIVYLDVSFMEIQTRIARNPQRGIAINPGESIEELFRQRQLLYEKFANIKCDAEKNSPAACVDIILEKFKEDYDIQF